ncbi:MAG: ATP-binding protein [Okeania sp. SIO2H7]|nr:ATP-binding protein [Okeania sp. SIO2H7]
MEGEIGTGKKLAPTGGSMKFNLSNLGYLERATLELGDLTIICGKNNTGKTYVNYAIYGFMESWKSNIDLDLEKEIETLFQDGVLKINLASYKQKFIDALGEVANSYSEFIPNIFGVGEDSFQETSFKVILDEYRPDYSRALSSTLSTLSDKEILKVIKQKESEILEITLLVKDKSAPPKQIVENFVNLQLAEALGSHYFSNAFIITSERTGVALFYKELDLNKKIIVEKLQNKKGSFNPSDFLEMLHDSLSRYSRPIRDEINFVRDLDDLKKKKGQLLEKHPEILSIFEEIVGGEYQLENDSIFFEFKDGETATKIPFHAASSTVKSLLNMNFYLKHLAKEGDILIIDEPELNLHPANQRKLAKLFSRLIKCGIKLLMTTHSDYLIKELNNLIVLNNNFASKQELMDKYNYTDLDVLDKNRVKVYIAEKQTLTPAEITDIGIEVGTFDREIIEMNNFFDEATVELDSAYDF